MKDKERFIELSEQLADGLLREAIGFTIEARIPYYKGIVGYMVEAPMLWIRHSRFPIFFIAYDQHRPDVLSDVVKQLEIANATEYFAILVVVPTRQGTGSEADELRHLVNNSVYHHDFVVLGREHLESIIARNNSQRLVEIILEQGIELSSLSPYVTKGPVQANMFFGREREIKSISQTVQRSDYSIVGGRRIGKSSVLLRLNHLLNNDPRYLAVYLNCEDQVDEKEFLGALGSELAGALDSAERAGARPFVAALRAAYPGQQILFFLDEVDQLLVHDAAANNGQLFKAFRALSHQNLCHFVFSGSRVLYRHLHDPHSPFFNFCQEVPLKPLEAKAVAEIVRKPMRQLGISMPDMETLMERMVEHTSCHPSLVQWLCDRLLRQATDRRITAADLEALVATVDFASYFVETAWGDATPLEKILTLLIEGPVFTVGELVTAAGRHGITDRMAIREALEVLHLYALIAPEKGGRYRFTLTQFPQIVREIEDVPFLLESLLSQAAA